MTCFIWLSRRLGEGFFRVGGGLGGSFVFRVRVLSFFVGRCVSCFRFRRLSALFVGFIGSSFCVRVRFCYCGRFRSRSLTTSLSLSRIRRSSF